MIGVESKLDARVALITGAGSETGIGFACATALAALGARVFLTSTTERCVDRASALRAVGFEADAYPADLLSDGGAARVVRGARARFGAVDILVNNAGMTSVGDPMRDPQRVHELSREAWAHAIERNLTSAFLMTSLVLPSMMDRGWGRIVNIASSTGFTGAMVGESAYAAAKAGLIGWTRALALEYAPYGITANAVAPGWIATGSQTSAEAAQGAATPMRRSGTPAEVAEPVASLCGLGASYLTGQCIVIDGGNSIAEERALR